MKNDGINIGGAGKGNHYKNNYKKKRKNLNKKLTLYGCFYNVRPYLFKRILK